MQIFYKMEPRNLRAAYRFYCGKDLANAHDALADTKATAEVFFGQVQRYQNPENLHAEVPGQETAFESIANLHDFLHDASRVDFTGRFIRNSEGLIVFNFGAKKGEPAHKHPQVLHWMIDKDFPAQVKEIAKAILAGKMK
jgi:DNA polymerase-3 subunit epsilon